VSEVLSSSGLDKIWVNALLADTTIAASPPDPDADADRGVTSLIILPRESADSCSSGVSDVVVATD